MGRDTATRAELLRAVDAGGPLRLLPSLLSAGWTRDSAARFLRRWTDHVAAHDVLRDEPDFAEMVELWLWAVTEAMAGRAVRVNQDVAVHGDGAEVLAEHLHDGRDILGAPWCSEYHLLAGLAGFLHRRHTAAELLADLQLQLLALSPVAPLDPSAGGPPEPVAEARRALSCLTIAPAAPPAAVCAAA